MQIAAQHAASRSCDSVPSLTSESRLLSIEMSVVISKMLVSHTNTNYAMISIRQYVSALDSWITIKGAPSTGEI